MSITFKFANLERMPSSGGRLLHLGPFRLHVYDNLRSLAVHRVVIDGTPPPDAPAMLRRVRPPNRHVHPPVACLRLGRSLLPIQAVVDGTVYVSKSSPFGTRLQQCSLPHKP